MTKTNKTEAEILARALRNRQLHSGQDGLLLVQDFLAFIGHPERSFQPFHIAGTSGKGSTAICLSKLLGAHGFKTGLMQSPHLTDIRERFMINNKFLEHNKTLGYFKEFTTKLDCFEKTDKRRLNYFQIMTTFAFFVFRKENTRFAVIEVGIGGLFDSTNALPKEGKIAIITRIGKDHTEILGKKLSEIAYQKAMIMGQSSICLSSPQSLSAKKIIIDVAKTQKSELYLSEKSITNIRRSDTAHLVDFKHESTFFNDLEITPKAPFQT